MPIQGLTFCIMYDILKPKVVQIKLNIKLCAFLSTEKGGTNE